MGGNRGWDKRVPVVVPLRTFCTSSMVTGLLKHLYYIVLVWKFVLFYGIIISSNSLKFIDTVLIKVLAQNYFNFICIFSHSYS